MNYTVDYKEIVKDKYGNRRWTKSIGKNIYIYHDGQTEVVTIQSYSNPVFTLAHNNIEYKRSRETLKKQRFDFLFNFSPLTVGNTVYLKTGPIKILEKKIIKTSNNYSLTYFTFQCLTCNQKVKSSSLYSLKQCPICSNKKVISGYNSIKDTLPEMMKVLANPLDALNHVAGSRISLKCICPNCKNEIWTTPQNFKRFGLFCHNCQKRKMSFPEIFIYILLLEVLTKKEIENEKVFNWAYSLNNPKWHLRYDFYLTPLNCIIEVHGSHHYKALKSAKCLEEFKINDRRKQRLAFYNNISNYIVIDARYSQPCYLIRSILQNEKFIELFKSLNLDLSQQDDIFWNNINEKAKVFKSNQKR